MDLSADLAAFFSDFGIAATVGGVSCVGLFDNGYAQALGFVAGTEPTLVVKAADVPDVEQGDEVVVVYGDFSVTNIEPDGTGLVLLRLQKL